MTQPHDRIYTSSRDMTEPAAEYPNSAAGDADFSIRQVALISGSSVRLSASSATLPEPLQGLTDRLRMGCGAAAKGSRVLAVVNTPRPLTLI
jgi:hypothetical protein